MAGFEFEFEWDDRRFIEACDALIARGTSLRPLLAEIGSELVRSTQDRFVDQEDPDGVPWVDLAPETWARKRTDRILVEYGDLRGGISFDPTDDYVDVIADREYAAIHQFGGTPEMAPGPAAIPARPFLGIGREDAVMVVAAAERYLRDALGE